MALQEFERRLERLVEGVFAKAFRGRLTPIEVGRRLTREMDVRRTVGMRGVIAPNAFKVALSTSDRENWAQAETAMLADLSGYAREHAREEGYVFLGPVSVEFVSDASLTEGHFMVAGELVEGPGGGPSGALVLPDGNRVDVGSDPVSIGRSPDCDIPLSPDDLEISRQHAEVRREEGVFVLVDLGSKNGTRVNGQPTNDRTLQDGDVITIGATSIRFELT